MNGKWRETALAPSAVSTTQTRELREPVESDQADVALITFIAGETELNLGSLGASLVCEANLQHADQRASGEKDSLTPIAAHTRLKLSAM